MRTGFFVVGILLLAAAVLWALTLVFVLVGLLFGICGALLVAFAFREEGRSAVVAVAAPVTAEHWYHPHPLGPMPPPAPLPIVVPVRPGPPDSAFSLPAASPLPGLVVCRACGNMQPNGYPWCSRCGAPNSP